MKLKIDFEQELKNHKEFKVQKLNLIKTNYTLQELSSNYYTQIQKNIFFNRRNINNQSFKFSFKTNIVFKIGDAIAISPKNNILEIKKLLNKLNYKNMYIKELQKSTIDALLQLDLAITKKSHFRILAEFSKGDDKQRLLFISSKQGKSLFDLLVSQYPTLLDLLDLFPSLDIPLDILLVNLPLLKARFIDLILGIIQ